MINYQPSDFLFNERQYFFPNFELGLKEEEDDYQSKSFYPSLTDGEDQYSNSDLGLPELKFDTKEKEEKTEFKMEINNIPKTTVITPDSLNNVGFEEARDTQLRGRKRKGNHEKRKHDKNREDNKVRKIKSYIINSVPDYVNESLSPQHKQFLKISKKVNEELNITYNRALMQKSLAEIFAENPINGRYSKKNYPKNYNAKLVDEIYTNNEELEAIEKLNLTYKQYLDIFREKNLEKFKNDIKLKEIKNGEDESTAKKYTGELVNLLLGYEDWFNNKTARIKGNKN
jgi:hypothetical protein